MSDKNLSKEVYKDKYDKEILPSANKHKKIQTFAHFYKSNSRA